MAFLNPAHRGLAYGDGYLQGDGALGQLVKIVGNDLFAVNTTGATPSVGILVKDYRSGDMPAFYCDGGVYETDVFEGVVNAGDILKCSVNGKLAAGLVEGDQAVAIALSVSGGTLKFRLLI